MRIISQVTAQARSAQRFVRPPTPREVPLRPKLISLPYSPWSERAAWALDARGVAFDREHYSPVLGELRLRRLRGSASGPASVPVLVHDGGTLTDSAEIARWADQRGDGPRLFPDDPRLQVVVDASEAALRAGRVRALDRALADGEALLDFVPRPLRRLGPIARFIAAFGVRRTLRKYARAADGDPLASLRAALGVLRGALAAAPSSGSGPKTLLGAFSYADIAATQALVFVAPPAPGGHGLRIGSASRRAFHDPDVADEVAELAAWRNQIYAAWRATPSKGT